MELTNKIKELSERIPGQVDLIKTEEATKNSFVMPFINALGYDIFNPAEVVPEYIADVGMKKGEKVDYAIIKDDQPAMLFECKWCGFNLDDSHAAQLRRYFHVTEARIGILTNGLLYKIYSDLDEPNIMDEKPFLELNIVDLDESLIDEIKKLAKSSFELETMLSTANDLKYTRQIKNEISKEFKDPSIEFVRFFASKVYPKKLMPSVVEQFTGITKKGLSLFIKESINDRLKSVISEPEESNTVSNDASAESEIDDSAVVESDNGIITTEEELEGYRIVRAILREVVEPERVAYRDTKSYFGILLDDNNRKPLCRLHFNTAQKYVGTFNKEKKETRHPIDNLSDIYSLAAQLKDTFLNYAPLETDTDE